MNGNSVVVGGSPTREEAAAVFAAVQVLLEGESRSQPQLPWAYRSAWRRASIQEGLVRGPAQAVTHRRTREN